MNYATNSRFLARFGVRRQLFFVEFGRKVKIWGELHAGRSVAADVSIFTKRSISGNTTAFHVVTVCNLMQVFEGWSCNRSERFDALSINAIER